MKNSIILILLLTACGEKAPSGEDVLTTLYCNEDMDQNKIKDDVDCDGVLTTDDCDDDNADLLAVSGDNDCDGVLTADDCDDGDPISTTKTVDGDCDGVLKVDDCDDGDVGLLAVSGDGDCDGVLTADDCDDGDAISTIKSEDGDCDGVLTEEDCDDEDADNMNSNVNDADCDNVPVTDDCDDNNPSSTITAEDEDCDGILTTDDCNDQNDSMPNNDMDCDGIPYLYDCNDEDSSSTIKSEDGDCDGVLTNDDCDDNDANTVNDMDCDGVLSTDDCDDSDSWTVNDMDCDGIPYLYDCDDGDVDLLTVLEDMDCDGVLAEEDCDDSDDLNTDVCITLANGIEIMFSKVSGNNLVDPLGRYTLSHAFYMMTTEVTQGMFQELMGYDSGTGSGDGDNYPAYYVNWHMAAHFANTLSIDQGEQECYSCSGSGTSVTCSETMDPYLCTGYSLPTEHEWEIAARSGTTSDFWTGEGSNLGGNFSHSYCSFSVTILDGVSNPPLSDYAWFCVNSAYGCSEVGTKLPNGFGLYDMHGNLTEWTSDWHGCTYPNSGTWCNSGTTRVTRGGNWGNSAVWIGSSDRYSHSPTFLYDTFGFRLRRIVNP